jgi:uncharacterized protein YcaQ
LDIVAAALSAFDNLLWDRPFVRRVFGFDHVMEIYKRAPERCYGYYVPFPSSGAVIVSPWKRGSLPTCVPACGQAGFRST